MPSLTHSFIGGAFIAIAGRPKAPDGGVVFVLDMGEPVRIVDLARDLIRLSGQSEEQVPIVYTGLRPGERLHESLMHDHETRRHYLQCAHQEARQGSGGVQSSTGR